MLVSTLISSLAMCLCRVNSTQVHLGAEAQLDRAALNRARFPEPKDSEDEYWRYIYGMGNASYTRLFYEAGDAQVRYVFNWWSTDAGVCGAFTKEKHGAHGSRVVWCEVLKPLHKEGTPSKQIRLTYRGTIALYLAKENLIPQSRPTRACARDLMRVMGLAAYEEQSHHTPIFGYWFIFSDGSESEVKTIHARYRDGTPPMMEKPYPISKEERSYVRSTHGRVAATLDG